MFRCGDSVFHKPSGETWEVAYADYEAGDLGWSGWPEGYGKISDCELKRACTDDIHKQRVAEWLEKPRYRDGGGLDRRYVVIRRLYGDDTLTETELLVIAARANGNLFDPDIGAIDYKTDCQRLLAHIAALKARRQ